MTQSVLFERQGEAFLPTELAGSPWHTGVLHGGAPAGLLAYCLEQKVANSELQPVRLTIDLMRPVPKAALKVSFRTLRTGRRIALEEATLWADDKPVAVASALFTHTQSVVVPDYAPQQALTLPAYESLSEVSFRDVLFSGNIDLPPGLHTTVQLRPASKLCEQGQGKAWLRLPVTLVAGEATSPFMLVALMSDFSNGVGQLSLSKTQGIINADITLHILRLPQSEWIGIDARTLLQSNGVALVQAQLFDHQGLIGQVSQCAMPMGS